MKSDFVQTTSRTTAEENASSSIVLGHTINT